MESGQCVQIILDDDQLEDSMDPGHICFNCEQIFADRKCLEEHICPSVSFICSCGTEFREYKDMQKHTTTHQPGHQVLDHNTIKMRRIERHIEDDEKLKRLQQGEVVWNASNESSRPSVSLAGRSTLQGPNFSALKSHVSKSSAQTSQVPVLLSNPKTGATAINNIFKDVGAPTVDLWSLYQPVVMLRPLKDFPKKKPYTCGKCGQGFTTRASLLFHHSSHTTDKVHGCIACGMLLSSKKLVPRFHACNSLTSQSKFRLITAKPLNYKPQNVGRKTLLSLPNQAVVTQQLKNQRQSVGTKISRAAPSMQKNLNIRTYSNNQGFHVGSPLQSKNQNPSVSKASPVLFLPSKTSNINRSNTQKQMVFPPVLPNMTSNPLICRVCHLPFESAQRLQRHKCAKAQEFMSRNIVGAKRDYKLAKMTPLNGPRLAPIINGERKIGLSPSLTAPKKSQIVSADADMEKVGGPENGGGDEDDDDCFIVETEPDKPAEVIYKVTSSVPIKS